MSHGYTPGLKVSARTRVVKKRLLPLKGETLAAAGDRVRRDQIIARALLPGDVYMINIANKLGVSPAEAKAAMLKKEGEAVVKGETIAEFKSFFGLIKTTVKSDCDGIIENVSSVTGQVAVRGAARPVNLSAYIDGVVREVYLNEGAAVECEAAYLQGIFGVGQETFGTIKFIADSPDSKIDENDLNERLDGAIAVAGGFVTAKAIAKARALGAKALVTGGLDDIDLKEFLGYDLGVAITGDENLGITLVVTEGFGPMAMSPRAFELLKTLEGMNASVNGATQIRAGVIRPEIIAPLEGSCCETNRRSDDQGESIKIGDAIRCIRAPYFGLIGIIAALPNEPARLECGSKARILIARLPDGRDILVPRANIERIES